jgi:putative transposase
VLRRPLESAQFTSAAFTGLLAEHGVAISMDGKGRCIDNIFIKRLWRSLKYENVYLHAYASIADARAGIGAWLNFYNEERLHQAHGYRTPRQIYEMQCPWTSGRSAAPNGSAPLVCRAGSTNQEMLTFAPMPAGISNKDLEIGSIAATLQLAPTPMPGINPAQ